MPQNGNETRVNVWDLPIRLFHWTLAATVTVMWFTGEFGKLNIHMILGIWVLALLLFRLGWGVIGSPTARFSHFVRGPGAIRAYVAAARSGTARSIGHNPLGALSVLALLAVLIAQSATGLFTSDDIFSEGPLAHLATSETVSLLSTLHRLGGKVLLGLVGLHLAAVVFYALVKKDDLVRAMITGTKAVPAGVQGIRFANPLLALALAVFSAALIWGCLALLTAH